MPRRLQQQIHSSFATGISTWQDFKSGIVDLYSVSGSQVDFNDHLIREFNRKVDTFDYTGLMFEPYDGGFRLISNTGIVL